MMFQTPAKIRRSPTQIARPLFVASLIRLALALLLFTVIADAAAERPQTSSPQVLLVYVRDGCPHCADAKKYLRKLARHKPNLRIVYRAVDKDPRAAEELERYSRQAGQSPAGVPTFVVNGQVHVGFISPQVTGPHLERLLDGGTAPPGKTEEAGFGDLRVDRLGLPLFTIALGLLDGFNPCAMWVLLFLLSLLVRLQDRRRMALIAGTFVLVSGVVYYAFMAAWLNLFLVLGFSNWLRWALAAIAIGIGLVNLRDFFNSRHGYTLAIPESAKPGLYARVRNVLRSNKLLTSLLGVATLAVLVNFIELLCTAGLPAIYTAVLSQQALSAPVYYGYLGLYILAYIADDALMVTIAVMALGSRKLSEGTGRWLKLISGLVMLLLGMVMLLFPGLLI
ncbi:glutaredoxin domain-containing protein [Microbulbifer aggregans]|uniref:glutaredoxin domain-containing protein n=1 Tax=Microbulbifer aggregans TaxID=1769779 RepID=UPI001CFE7144|nr:glutaredoxin domain-containing protein [Microbulbifer aggregans]